MLKRQRGDIGEKACVKYLEKKGFDIIAKNYTSRFGEIDIIAKSSEYIIFAEVKTRNPNSIASPAEFVTKSKQNKIAITAVFYLKEHKIKLQPRFDVFEVTIDLNEPPKVTAINHIENAFNGGRL